MVNRIEIFMLRFALNTLRRKVILKLRRISTATDNPLLAELISDIFAPLVAAEAKIGRIIDLLNKWEGNVEYEHIQKIIQ